jgi:hypothetical protein
MYYANILYIATVAEATNFLVHFEGFWSNEDHMSIDSDRLMKISEEVKRIKLQMESLDESGSCYINQKPQDVVVVPAEYLPNEKVFVIKARDLYGAKILKLTKNNGSAMYKVHYNGRDKEFDEWVRDEDIIRRTRTSEMIKSKLQKYKNFPNSFRKSIAFNQENSRNRESNIDVIRATADESKSKEDNMTKNGNIQTLSRAGAILYSTSSKNEMVANDSYQKYLSKRSMTKKYEEVHRQSAARLKEVEEKNVRLKEENRALKDQATYTFCQKCKKHYSSFRENEGKQLAVKCQNIKACKAFTNVET